MTCRITALTLILEEFALVRLLLGKLPIFIV